MSDEGIKVTDRRMFTPDGELREEYRHLAEGTKHRTEQGEDRRPEEAGGSRETAPTGEGRPPRAEEPPPPAGPAAARPDPRAERPPV